jgi:hypothetical protein
MPDVHSNKSASTRLLRVFLCYASEDRPAVRQLYHRLCADGVDAWLDVEKLLPGEVWREAIPRAVRASDVVIVCLSHNSTKAGYVQKEIRLALDVADEQPEGTIFLIPARLEEYTVPDRLSCWHWVNLFEEKGYERLMRALHARANALGISLSPAQIKRETAVSSKPVAEQAVEERLQKPSILEVSPPSSREVSSPSRPLPEEAFRNRFLIVCGGSGTRLLGQRRVLGISGELHIDASTAVKERPEDQRSLGVKLDKSVSTTAALLLDIGKRVGKSPTLGLSDYVQTAITHPQDVEHAKFLMDYWPASGPLQDALAQSPTISGAAVRSTENMALISTQLRRMVTEFAVNVGRESPLDIWIISSTAGGTGEGIHRFVAALLAETVNPVLRPFLKLNFIRIGSLTYRRVNVERTMLNTFFGIAADAAFELKFREDFPDAVSNWFYTDLLDVGIGGHGTAVLTYRVSPFWGLFALGGSERSGESPKSKCQNSPNVVQ